MLFSLLGAVGMTVTHRSMDCLVSKILVGNYFVPQPSSDEAGHDSEECCFVVKPILVQKLGGLKVVTELRTQACRQLTGPLYLCLVVPISLHHDHIDCDPCQVHGLQHLQSGILMFWDVGQFRDHVAQYLTTIRNIAH